MKKTRKRVSYRGLQSSQSGYSMANDPWLLSLPFLDQIPNVFLRFRLISIKDCSEKSKRAIARLFLHDYCCLQPKLSLFHGGVMRIRQRSILLLLTAGLMGLPAEASVIFDNFSGNPGWNTQVASGIPSDQARGWAFTATSSQSLDNIVLPLAHWFTSPAGNATVLLMNDLAGAVNPNSVLESWDIFVSTFFGGTPVTTLVSQLHPSMVQGTQYWLAVLNPAGGGSDMLSWHNSLNSVAPGTVYWNGSWSSGGQPTGQAAMQLNGSPAAVPEPESYAMLLAGLGMLGFFARRRKQNAA